MGNLVNAGRRGMVGWTGALLALTLGLASCGTQGAPPAGAASEVTLAGAEETGAEETPGTLETQTLEAGSNTLSAEPFVAVSNGWGPVERDRSNGEQAAGDGRALTLNGKGYARGFGTHAGSSMTFNLEGRCATLTASVGVDDEVGNQGSVVFQVYADGVKLYDSGRMTGKSATKTLSVPVTGKRELKLVVTDAGDGNAFDHADWAQPTLTGCVAPAPAPTPAPAPAPVPPPTSPTPTPVTYSAPLTITAGGTYSGNWENTGTGAAIVVKTSEPVVIQNANLRSRGPLIVGFGVDLTIRNVKGISLTPNILGRAAEMAVKAEDFRNLRVENSTFTGGGIYARRWIGDASQGQGIRILKNTFVNIDGRKSDGAGGYSGSVIRQMVQFNDVTRIPTAEIAWNQNVNEAYKSAGEDLINMYASSGTPTSPIRIHDNYVQGSYPANPSVDGHSGGGILLGDGVTGVAETNGYQHAYDNQVVSTTNYGMAIIGGWANRLENNRVISSGRLPDGSRIAAQNVGLYVWDMYGSGAAFGMNVMQNNVSGWTKVSATGTTSQNNWWLPNGTTNGSVAQNNTWLGTQTLDSEKAEYARWQQKLTAAGVVIGAR